jgi:hypothetical protein
MDKRDFLEKQLNHYYSWIISDKSRSVTIRSWSITVWIFSMALLLTLEKVNLSLLSLVIIYLPLFLFWILDGFQNSFIESNERQAKRIEQMLVSEDLEKVDLSEYLLISSHINRKFFSKVKSLLAALFLRETVFVFYFILFVASLVLVILEANKSANF